MRLALLLTTASWAALGAEPANIQSLLGQGFALSGQAKYEDAEQKFREAVAEAEQLGRFSGLYGEALNGLGFILYKRGRFVDAVPLFQQAVEIQERLEEAAKLADTLNNLATAYRQLGRFEDSEKAYTRALEFSERVHAPGQPGSHAIAINLALLRMHLGKWKPALETATGAAEMLRRTLGDNHLDYASAVSAQSLIHYQMGDYYVAERLARRVVVIRERRLGRDHPDTARR